MTIGEAALLKRIKARAALVQPEMAKRLLAAYRMIRNSLTEAELVRAINAGQVEALINALLSDSTLDPAFAPLRALIDRAVMDAGTKAVGDIPSGIRPPTFDVLNPKVIQAARALDTAVIQGLKDDVRKTVAQHVMGGLTSGTNPRTIARRLPGVIGLGPTQEKAVANFRLQLETGDRAALARSLGRGKLTTEAGTVITRAAHAGGKGLGARDLTALDVKLGRDPLTEDQVNRMTEAYRNKLEAWNTESVTRTATLDAQRAGQRLSWEDAADKGYVDRASLKRTWIGVMDSRERPEHVAMQGETVGFDTPFSNGEFEPGDSTYNCRCLVRVTSV